MRDDLVGGKADATFGKLMEMVPKMKWQWKILVNPLENEPKRGLVCFVSFQELPNFYPIVEAWHMGKNMGEAYIDSAAQVCVITHACVEKFGLHIVGNSRFCIRMANHQKVKCLGIVQNLEIEVFEVKSLENSHVILVGLGDFPIILGGPWLRGVGDIQYWRRGVITLYNKKGDKKWFHKMGFYIHKAPLLLHWVKDYIKILFLNSRWFQIIRKLDHFMDICMVRWTKYLCPGKLVVEW